MMGSELHTSVLLDECVAGLAVVPDGLYLDATVGLGGHAEAILKASAPGGRVIGIDRDPDALAHARGRLQPYGDRVRLVLASFGDVSDVLLGEPALDGALADVGVSSLQLDRPERGFSFRADGPLDMRMGPDVSSTAAELLAGIDATGLTEILRTYGEVTRPKRMARAIIAARDDGRLASTLDLKRIVESVEGSGGPRGTHPATRTFQALRIAVNRELDELEGFLRALEDLVRPGGRVAIISFHSLEDRIVKTTFADPPTDPAVRHLPITSAPGPWQVITRRPIVPTAGEIAANPRARSAKLRIAERRAA